MEESFWDICLDRLVAETRAAIATFAQTHRDEEVCYFAYDAEPHSGYQGFTTIEFPEWQAFAESAEYPAGDDDSDYLTNRAARLFCRAFVRLVQEQAFAELKLAQPTLLGFAFHDDEQVIVEMLGIPSA